LLLKRNAIVPFAAGNLSSYANAPQTLPLFFSVRNLRLDRKVAVSVVVVSRKEIPHV
jgi:hypothetical protein